MLVSQMNPASLEPNTIRAMARGSFDQLPNNKTWSSSTHNVHKAEQRIESCEHCNPEGAEIPFDNILGRITGSNPSVTDYILESPAKCPNCRREILEKTLIEPA